MSRWQGNINWGDVAKSGVSFVFVKASQNKIDPMFIQNITGARKAGLLVGAYHYLDESVTTPAQARAAANKFYTAILAGGGVDLPPVLDYESKATGVTPAQATAIALAFLQEIERLTGKRPMLYTYPSFIGNFTGLSAYPLWIARYSASRVPEDAQGWRSWEFWQYSDGTDGGTLPSSSRKVNGISGPVDLNEFNGTVADLQRKYGKREPAAKPEESSAQSMQKQIRVLYEDTVGIGYLIGDTTYVSVTSLADVFRFTVGFNDSDKAAIINGRQLQDTRLIDGKSYVQVRPLVESFGGALVWDNNTKKLMIKKG
ncbi:GH25 family lysozyme [Paenibacillus hunanensis]|uniref:Lysozyme n=1 Tax=Paenibacillus hunanensis TaxID=539262 RepID=A0ABU1IV35_9BACL|nr:GH25 family lysozyme [Paenibacillus hunanensis]MDR6243129.1 lysozyme [Paenibacillus hunanensis]